VLVGVLGAGPPGEEPEKRGEERDSLAKSRPHEDMRNNRPFGKKVGKNVTLYVDPFVNGGYGIITPSVIP
jgi:hypothetical protein